jgi:hypothetical protein
MKIVRKNTHVKGRPVVAKAPRDLNGDNLFDMHLLPYLLYHKASEKEQKKFRLLCHRISWNGVKKGRKEMKDQMLDLFERLKAKKIIESSEGSKKTA